MRLCTTHIQVSVSKKTSTGFQKFKSCKKTKSKLSQSYAKKKKGPQIASRAYGPCAHCTLLHPAHQWAKQRCTTRHSLVLSLFFYASHKKHLIFSRTLRFQRDSAKWHLMPEEFNKRYNDLEENFSLTLAFHKIWSFSMFRWMLLRRMDRCLSSLLT